MIHLQQQQRWRSPLHRCFIDEDDVRAHLTSSPLMILISRDPEDFSPPPSALMKEQN